MTKSCEFSCLALHHLFTLIVSAPHPQCLSTFLTCLIASLTLSVAPDQISHYEGALFLYQMTYLLNPILLLFKCENSYLDVEKKKNPLQNFFNLKNSRDLLRIHRSVMPTRYESRSYLSCPIESG